MSEREHIVSVNRGVDLVAFNQEMIATTGAGSIPSRTVGVADPRATNIRSTHYMLTDAEAETLKADPRVFGVDLLPELDPTIGIGFECNTIRRLYKNYTRPRRFPKLGYA